MGTVVAMQYGPLKQIAQTFQQVMQALKTVIKVLSALIQILRAMAFASMGTSLALANYLEQVKRNIENVIKILDEMSSDLLRAIKDHEAGVFKSGTYFTRGINLSG